MPRAYYFVLLGALTQLLNAQAVTALDDAIRVGPGVKPPRLLHKVEPEYSPDARAGHIQGNVLLQLAVDEQGKPVGVSIISPLGYGLDERPQAAVETWRFAPGTKDGKPVKILATVEVAFRFPELWFDEKVERQRTTFNESLHTLSRPGANAKIVDSAVKSIQDLAKQRFPAAMYLPGLWETDGEHVPKAQDDGLVLFQRAAAKNYGPAIYQVAIRQIEGRDLPKDFDKGMEAMRTASILGSPQAQYYLGNRYEVGDGVPQELDRARRYFRLCAAQGVAQCQIYRAFPLQARSHGSM